MVNDKVMQTYIYKIVKCYNWKKRQGKIEKMKIIRTIQLMFIISGFIHNKLIIEMNNLWLKLYYPHLLENHSMKEMKNIIYYTINDKVEDINME